MASPPSGFGRHLRKSPRISPIPRNPVVFPMFLATSSDVSAKIILKLSTSKSRIPIYFVSRGGVCAAKVTFLPPTSGACVQSPNGRKASLGGRLAGGELCPPARTLIAGAGARTAHSFLMSLSISFLSLRLT